MAAEKRCETTKVYYVRGTRRLVVPSRPIVCWQTVCCELLTSLSPGLHLNVKLGPSAKITIVPTRAVNSRECHYRAWLCSPLLHTETLEWLAPVTCSDCSAPHWLLCVCIWSEEVVRVRRRVHHVKCELVRGLVCPELWVHSRVGKAIGKNNPNPNSPWFDTRPWIYRIGG
jgi:hypothetical protein